MSRFGFPSFFRGGGNAAAHSRVQSTLGASGMRGTTFRHGRGSTAIGFSVRRTPTGRIKPRNKLLSPRFNVAGNPRSVESRPRVSGGAPRIGSANQSMQVGANAVRQLIKHYGKVPSEISKVVRAI